AVWSIAWSRRIRDNPGHRPPPAPPGRNRRGKGDARKLLETTLELLIKDGIWGKTNKGIFELAMIHKSTFYQLTGAGGPLAADLDRYRRLSRGKGPARPRKVQGSDEGSAESDVE